MSRKTCASCVYAKVAPPKDWKPWYDQEFRGAPVYQEIYRHGLALPLQCTFGPVWLNFTTNHYCGRWTADVEMLAGADYRLVQAWHERDRLEARVKLLKAQLKKVQQISASRLARLKESATSETDQPDDVAASELPVVCRADGDQL